jgi:hypothetical protein
MSTAGVLIDFVGDDYQKVAIPPDNLYNLKAGCVEGLYRYKLNHRPCDLGRGCIVHPVFGLQLVL